MPRQRRKSWPNSPKFDEAFAAIDEAREAIWAPAPLTFREALFVASDPQGFGIFDARESSTFKRSEPHIIYSEPMGYGQGLPAGDYTVTTIAHDKNSPKTGEFTLNFTLTD